MATKDVCLVCGVWVDGGIQLRNFERTRYKDDVVLMVCFTGVPINLGFGFLDSMHLSCFMGSLLRLLSFTD